MSTRILILIQISGKEDETVASGRQGSLEGRGRWWRSLAETERAAFEAIVKVKVDYEVLPAVFNMEDALKPGAPVVNETYHGQNTYHL